MPRYFEIRKYQSTQRKRIIDRLLSLREELSLQVPKPEADSLLLATWNIRDFDSNKFGNGPRLEESFHYIAEIISRFDLVAVQEVNRDLKPLQKLIFRLGPQWEYIVTGVTEGSSGNDERMAFVYNRNRVSFTNLAGQVVLPEKQLISHQGGLQFARTPYTASFQVGWFKFNLCTVHIFFGEESGESLNRRIDEINKIAQHFKKLQKKDCCDYILLGDFNIVSPQHKTMEALESNGFFIPDDLKTLPSNLWKNKHYDQIAFKQHDKRLEFGRSGVFDFRSSVFRDVDFEAYYNSMPAENRDFKVKDGVKVPTTDAEKRDYYNKEWITWQMSDHLIMWVELKVDFTADYLNSLKPGEKALAVFDC